MRQLHLMSGEEIWHRCHSAPGPLLSSASLLGIKSGGRAGARSAREAFVASTVQDTLALATATRNQQSRPPHPLSRPSLKDSELLTSHRPTTAATHPGMKLSRCPHQRGCHNGHPADL